MIRPGEDDLLTLLTREALAGVMAEAKASGRIRPRIFYSTGRARVRSFMLNFDDFLAVALSVHYRFDAQQALLATVGFDFYTVAATFAAMSAGKADLLTPEAVNWDSTRYVLLRSAGPKFVVVADRVEMGAPGLPGPAGASTLVAIGLHPASILAFSSTYHAGHPRGLVFGPISALSAGAAQVCGLKTFLKIFGPENN
ncbi:MAG: hypothetical protein A2516_08435 [Alphaproteobacteria bacterium RIFOXYD12_FULL_60_8]|nr:MAG: hypothetical protein A2516_08435 [Alphaproteobacteria bacterium RIFOXYD12_FULL_60_8]